MVIHRYALPIGRTAIACGVAMWDILGERIAYEALCILGTDRPCVLTITFISKSNSDRILNRYVDARRDQLELIIDA